MDENEGGHEKDIEIRIRDVIQGTVFYFAVPCISPPIDAPNAANVTALTGPTSYPIVPPTNEPTIDPRLVLSQYVPLSPDAIYVNKQKHSYMRCKILAVMEMKVIVL